MERMTAARKAGFCAFLYVLWLSSSLYAAEAELIVHNGKIITVDADFSIAQAMAVGEGRILAVGKDADVMALKGAATRVIDLKRNTVLPGLIDSHVHPSDAAMTEFDHPVPTMESIADVLSYVRDRAKAVGPGKWVTVSQVFITRLKEQRYPTRVELDEAAPQNPVIFATGPDASVNSLGLKESGIDKDFKPPAGTPGFAEKDPATGELTGVLRGYQNYFKGGDSPSKSATEEDRYRRTLELFHDYNAHGLTTIGDRAAGRDALNRYKAMRDKKDLPLRIFASQHIDGKGATIEDLSRQIQQVGDSALHTNPDPMLGIIGIKMFLDGGMLTGSAYMSEPWGVSKIYGISDPKYQGVLLMSRERLTPVVRAAGKAKLQFTAHCVGDGGVTVLLDAYENVLAEKQELLRPCITHCNFLSTESIQRMKKMGVVADIQPIWLYSDARTLCAQFGDERLKLFQPLKTMFDAGVIVGGGSDHMQKIGADRAINQYDPFLGMWITLTRQARWQDTPLHPEQALSREQAIRMYTTNNAWLLFRESQIGALKKGMLADFIVIDRDVLTCPIDEVRKTTVLETYVNGKSVYTQKSKN